MTDIQAARDRVRQCLLDLPSEMRVWARTEYHATYLEALQLERTAAILEEVDAMHGYLGVAGRLVQIWEDLRNLWEADR